MPSQQKNKKIDTNFSKAFYTIRKAQTKLDARREIIRDQLKHLYGIDDVHIQSQSKESH